MSESIPYLNKISFPELGMLLNNPPESMIARGSKKWVINFFFLHSNSNSYQCYCLF